MIEAGKLRHRVTVIYFTYVQDSFGSPVPQEHELGKFWAEVRNLSGRELMAAQAENSKVIGRIRMRRNDDIEHGMMIDHRGKRYNIEAVIPDEDSGLEFITIPFSEGVRENE